MTTIEKCVEYIINYMTLDAEIHDVFEDYTAYEVKELREDLAEIICKAIEEG